MYYIILMCLFFSLFICPFFVSSTFIPFENEGSSRNKCSGITLEGAMGPFAPYFPFPKWSTKIHKLQFSMFWLISLRFLSEILSKWPMIFGSRVNHELFIFYYMYIHTDEKAICWMIESPMNNTSGSLPIHSPRNLWCCKM